MDKGITTKEWKAAGLPFEGWLRYCQLSPEARQRAESLFRQRFGAACSAAKEGLIP